MQQLFLGGKVTKDNITEILASIEKQFGVTIPTVLVSGARNHLARLRMDDNNVDPFAIERVRDILMKLKIPFLEKCDTIGSYWIPGMDYPVPFFLTFSYHRVQVWADALRIWKDKSNWPLYINYPAVDVRNIVRRYLTGETLEEVLSDTLGKDLPIDSKSLPKFEYVEE